MAQKPLFKAFPQIRKDASISSCSQALTSVPMFQRRFLRCCAKSVPSGHKPARFDPMDGFLPRWDFLTEFEQHFTGNIKIAPWSIFLMLAWLGTSLSPKKHLMELRLDRAQHLLVQSEAPVIDIALACGSQNSSHFGKAYKSACGVSPRVQSRETGELAQRGQNETKVL
ncbi:MAG: helix-turn-helix domain-containing protein [Pseudomonadota bacterium]